MAARPAFEKLLGVPAVAHPASELGFYPPELFSKGQLLIAISRSGEKGDIMAAVRAAKQSDAFVVAITATPDSLLAEAADAVILTHEGPEHCQPKTKSFISVLGVLILLAIAQGDQLRPCRSVPDRRSGRQGAACLDRSTSAGRPVGAHGLSGLLQNGESRA